MKNLNFLQVVVCIVAFLSSSDMYSQITDTGNKVGIGVPVPQEKLSLPLNSEIGFTYASSQIAQLRIKGANNGMSFTSAYTTTQTAQSFAFFMMNNTPTEIQRLTILNNGKMGFNTIFVPQERITLPWEEEIGFSHASGAASQIKLKGGATGMIFTSAYTNAQDSTIKPFQFYTMNHESKPISRVTILNNGNVGIGTRNPKAPLSVKGQINAGSVEVTDIATWNDSVFLPSYKMKTLPEVENFIKENGHLPEVPSEKEVKQNGFDLAEMDATLLKKIEELTLYVIDQNKKIEALQNEIAKIKKEFAK
jgi:hypothetical protein